VKASRLVKNAVRTLKASDAIDHWQRDREEIEAEDLLQHALGGYAFDPDEEIPGGVRRRFEALIERRTTGEPIPYIKGYAVFRGLRLLARPGVFVPRDSTEFLAAQAVRRLRRRKGPVEVDLATGGGTVALAVANEVRRSSVFGTDLSEDAVALARKNAKRLKLRATFVAGDPYAPLPREVVGAVDVITLHPPYVAKRELRELPDEVRRFEPVHTLTDRSADGLGLVERAVRGAGEWLRPGGWLLIEVSPDRAKAVARLMRRAGLREVKSTKDRGFGVTRVVVGRW